MTKEEKQILLIDLCARLPYGVKCCARYNTGSRYNTNIITIIPENGTIVTKQNELHYQQTSLIEDCRPYLRPMSSMTAEEQAEFVQFHCVTLCPVVINNCLTIGNESKMIDWLLAHHFDYRGLIEKGLALEAPEGMYKNE